MNRYIGPKPQLKPKHGFSLIELMVVTGITAGLVALLLPALSKSKDAAMRIKCATNVRSIAQASLSYATDNNGWLPYQIGSSSGFLADAGYGSYYVGGGLWMNQLSGWGRLLDQSYVGWDSFDCPDPTYQNSIRYDTNAFDGNTRIGRSGFKKIGNPNYYFVESSYIGHQRYISNLDLYFQAMKSYLSSSTNPYSYDLRTIQSAISPHVEENLPGKAFVADLSLNPFSIYYSSIHSDVKPSHSGLGVNTGYLDGSAKWLSWKDFPKDEDTVTSLGVFWYGAHINKKSF